MIIPRPRPPASLLEGEARDELRRWLDNAVLTSGGLSYRGEAVNAVLAVWPSDVGEDFFDALLTAVGLTGQRFRLDDIGLAARGDEGRVHQGKASQRGDVRLHGLQRNLKYRLCLLPQTKGVSSAFLSDLNQISASLAVPSKDSLLFLAKRFEGWRQRTRLALRDALVALPADDPLCCPISLFRTMEYGRLETAHTRSLAWLLDPKSEHGFRDRLLAALLLRLSNREHVEGLSVDLVKTEHHVHSGNEHGRLDVIAEGQWREDGATSRWVLVIEAKIDARESIHQFGTYDSWLAAKPHHVFRVFLTPDGPRGGERWRWMGTVVLSGVGASFPEDLRRSA